jgi:hypothetical protein
MFDIETGKIKDFIKFDVGQLVMITGGHNQGRVGTIVSRQRHKGSFDIILVKDSVGHEFATRCVPPAGSQMNASAAGRCKGGDPVQAVLHGELAAAWRACCSLEGLLQPGGYKRMNNSVRVSLSFLGSWRIRVMCL